MSNRKSRDRPRAASPAGTAGPRTAVAAQPAPASASQPIAESDEAIELIETVFPVAGMTCRSCEIRIERNIRRIPGVERVSASATGAKVSIVSSGPVPTRQVAQAIEAAGYEVGHTPWLERNPDAWITAACGLIVLGIIAVIAKLTGIVDLASGAGDLSRGGVFVALLLGLAAGVSTCMALAGGIVLALSASYQARRGTAGDLVGRMRPAVVFVAGRIIGYTVFGAMLGALGSSFTLPTKVTAILMIVVAIVMTLVGTRLTGLSPRVAAWSPTLPAGFAHRLGLTNGSTGSSYSDGRAGLLGAASFFLPCGFTQAVQIYALSTGSPATAAILLGVFAIGTAPGLLGIAGLPALVPSRWRPDLLRIVGVVVIGFAVLNASSGLRLAGFTLPALGPGTVVAAGAAAAPAGVVAADGTQTLHTFQDVNGYSPSNVTIYAGKPTKWTIESLNGQTCATFLRIPDLDAAVTLKKGLNELNLPAMRAGTLQYTCAMGMYGGTITIVDPPTGAAGGANGG
jgi:sulfite exporter TauE/SafE/copper chaperone CopZ